jgi:hypothetical protein
MPRTVTRNVRSVDERIAQLARRQGGVASLEQMIEAGLQRATVFKRSARGWYVRCSQGVYAIGVGVLSRRGELHAALLAAPAGARVTGRTALQLRGIHVRGSDDITVVVNRRWRGVPGVRVINSKTLRSEDHDTIDGLPTTTVARALLDLAIDLDADQLGKVIHELDYRKLLRSAPVSDVLAHNPRHPGRRPLEEAMRRRDAGEAGTWSEFERRFHALLATADPTRALRNVCVPVEHGEPVRVDAFYQEERLCIELDPDHHLRPRSRRADADRDRLLDASGYARLRFTGDDVEYRGAEVVAAVRAELARLRHKVPR